MTEGFEWTDADSREAHVATYGMNHPWTRARIFLITVAQPAENLDVLSAIVTPESAPRWGDFTAASALLESWPNWSIYQVAHVHPQALDVAYVRIDRHDPLKPAWQYGALSFVWRPEAGAWLLHAMGPELSPEELPRTSPGNAPRVQP